MGSNEGVVAGVVGFCRGFALDCGRRVVEGSHCQLLPYRVLTVLYWISSRRSFRAVRAVFRTPRTVCARVFALVRLFVLRAL